MRTSKFTVSTAATFLYSLTARTSLLDLATTRHVLTLGSGMARCLAGVAAVNSPCTAGLGAILALACVALR